MFCLGEHQDVVTPTALEAVMPNEFPLSDEVDDLRQALREVETSIIRQRLRRFGGNRARAAESLGLPKRTLAHKCQQLELDGK